MLCQRMHPCWFSLCVSVCPTKRLLLSKPPCQAPGHRIACSRRRSSVGVERSLKPAGAFSNQQCVWEGLCRLRPQTLPSTAIELQMQWTLVVPAVVQLLSSWVRLQHRTCPASCNPTAAHGFATADFEPGRKQFFRHGAGVVAAERERHCDRHDGAADIVCSPPGQLAGAPTSTVTRQRSLQAVVISH